ncbi:MAG: sulfatase-like hydrolase/transferase [candidate division KSB1 bacterium]|nr:sulfatase-like hydrolase/transferase [candidate division KSB1 bacterium]
MLGFFRERGYKLGWIGKNHTFQDHCLRELDVWNERARESFRRYNAYVPPCWHSDMYLEEEKLHGTITTQKSIEFIRQKKDEPFFLHISYFDPHPPYFAPSAYTSRYCSQDIHLPPSVLPKPSARLNDYAKALHYDQLTDSDLTETLRYYYASVEWGVDYQVGRVLKTLRDTGLEDNTIVLFMSDHGDFMGDFRMVRKGMFLYDALLHAPLIWHAPGLIKQGQRVANLVQGVDIFPTFLDLIDNKTNPNMPGRSLVPFLQGKSKEEPEYTIYASAAYSDLKDDYFQNPEPRIDLESGDPFHTRIYRRTWKADQRTAMARTRDWKLILNESQPPELYNMNSGYLETENLAKSPEYTKVRKTLEQRIKNNWDWR